MTVDARDSRASGDSGRPGAMPASRAADQWIGLAAGETTWYGEGLHPPVRTRSHRGLG